MGASRRLVFVAAIAAGLTGAACSDDDGTTAGSPDDANLSGDGGCVSGESSSDEFPDVLEVDATEVDDDVWTFTVTMSSPYDTPERYADGWRVLGSDCTVYGIHTLTHDHADEQPFTRRQSGVAIPDDVEAVTVQGRDQANGFGGSTVTVTLDRS